MSDETQRLREMVFARAAAKAEASVYTLDNRYLTDEEKFEVELWFQFAGNVSLVTMFGLLVYSIFEPLTWMEIIFTTLSANISFGLLNWFFYSKKLMLAIYFTVFHNFVLWLATLATMGLLIYHGEYGKAGFAFFLKLLLIVVFEPHMFVYAVLSKKFGIHPKYAFFKKEYGMTFPFEEALNKEIV